MKRGRNHDFVYNGSWRARTASIDKIRAEVEREFAERLATAGWFERIMLQREMRRELKKRLDRVAAPWGLYFSEHR